MRPIIVAVGAAGLSKTMAELVARLAGTGEGQTAAVTVVHVAKVWGTALGLQHPALQPSAHERAGARDLVARAALELCDRGVEAEALLVSGRNVGKALAGVARRQGAGMVVIGRHSGGRLSRLLRGPDPARVVLSRVACTLVIADDEQ